MYRRAVVLAVVLGASLQLAPPVRALELCVPVPVGAAAPAVVASAPPGSHICFAPGIHRLAAPLRPKNGQTFSGAPGAILSGSVELTDFTASGDAWVTTHRYSPLEPAGTCAKNHADTCRYAETVYLEDRALRRAASSESVGPGDFYADGEQVWLGEDPTGTRVELSLTRAAFAASASDVTVRGFIVEKFANRAQVGAVQCGDRWLIESNEVRHNHGIGISAWSGSTVRNNHVHHNGQMGLSGTGDGITVEHNEIDHNNVAGFDAVWEAGGTKFVRTTSLVVRGNYSHHNEGPGLWADIDNIDVTFEDNLVTDNRGPGIFAEIGYGALIRANTVVGNGTGYRAWSPAGILILSTSNVLVTGNVVKGNRAGVVLINDGRPDGPLGPYKLRDVRVSGNVIRMPRGKTGMSDWTKASSAHNIQFDGNTYSSSQRRPFMWDGTYLSRRGWRAAGQT